MVLTALPDPFRLAVLPTPLVRARGLEHALGAGPIWVKRDDLTGFAAAGNKARPLEYLLGDALARCADVLVATGAAGSNFCAAAAVAARVAGLDCALLHPGSEPATPPLTVRLSRAAGATLTFDPSLARAGLDDAVQQHADRLRVGGSRPYAVPRGGATALGAVGFARAAHELAAQCAELGLERCTVVLPTGSGGSQAGLVAGCADEGLPLRVVGASVSRPVAAMRARVLELACACARLLGTPQPREADVDVRDAIGDGFGHPSAADRHSALIALTSEGLLLDDTYTAKAMTVLRELVGEQHDPIVFWHTSAGVKLGAHLTGDRQP